MRQYALYPGSFTYKYPVAGEPNSKVSLHSYDIDNRKTKDLSLPASDIEYIPRICYTPQADSRLIVTTLDRAQTRMELLSVNPKSGVCKSLLTEQSDAWLNPNTYENLNFLPSGMLLLSARTGFTHAYLYSYEGQLLKTVTSGDYDVKDFYGCDAKGNYYFQTTATGPINRVVTRIDAKGVTKHLTPANGNASAWFAPLDGPLCSHLQQRHHTTIVHTLHSSGRQESARARGQCRPCSEICLGPKPEFITVTTAEGITMDAYIIKPVNMDASRRYPLIITQYSGPGSQQVLDRWSVDWTQYAAMHGYVVMCVDPAAQAARDANGRQSCIKTSAITRPSTSRVLLAGLHRSPISTPTA